VLCCIDIIYVCVLLDCVIYVYVCVCVCREREREILFFLGLVSQSSVEEDEEKKEKGFEFQLNTPKKSLLGLLPLSRSQFQHDIVVVASKLEDRDGWLALLALLHKKKYAGGGSQRLSSNLLADTTLVFGAASAVRVGEEGVAGFIREGRK